MRHTIIALILVICGVASGYAADADREADHEALRALRTKVAAALSGQDLDTLAGCFTREFVFTTVDQTVITGTDQLRDYYRKVVAGEDSLVSSIESVPEADILTRFVGPDTGYNYGSSLDTYTLKNGDKVALKARWTAVVQREDGEWKVAAAHAGVNFLDNPVSPPAGASLWKRLTWALGMGGAGGQ